VRWLFTVLLVLLAACAAATTSNAATLKTPDPQAVGELSPSFVDSVLPATRARIAAAQAQTAEWGGPTTATDGETVTIYFSNSYTQDPTLQQKWADFLTSLVHGPEISTVAIHMEPLSEVQRFCGASAAACYSPKLHVIYAPGDNPDSQTTAEGVLAHEYGHHVANSRANPPFASVDYGTKRWSTYENVCSKANTGALFPGAEDSDHYKLNPGEAFAETYRLLNEQKLGIGIEPWNIVSTVLYPDETALSLLEQDVTNPWTANTVEQVSGGTLTSKVRTRTLTIATPLDGTLSFSPRQTGKATVAISLLSNGKTLASGKLAAPTARALSTTICGERAFTVREQLTGTVTSKTKTAVTLTVSTPQVPAAPAG
jgi:hypothetical protein